MGKQTEPPRDLDFHSSSLFPLGFMSFILNAFQEVLQAKAAEAESALKKPSLEELAKGLRENRHSESEYIETIIPQIKSELKGTDKDEKAQAVLKLVYVCSFKLKFPDVF